MNIFNFEKEIYGEEVTVYFESLLRTDTKFKDLEALKEQLHKDKAAAMALLKSV